MPIDKNADNIQVMVRVRPLNSRELAEEGKSCVIIDDSSPNTIILDAKPEQKKFNFDWIGGEATTQENIFEFAGKPMVQACLEGYNCCIFAYGQTGAGKTYTMQGRGLENDDRDNLNRGLQPRVFDYIFSITTKEMGDVPDTQFLVSCSYLEIYNEQIMDLLEPMNATLQVREDLKKGVYVEDLKEELVTTSEEAIGLLQAGAMNRHVGSTNMNKESSRSHSVFTMTIESKRCVNGIIHIKESKFHFVDLAGSERQKQTASAGERLKEAGNINKSLLVLGQVINSLVEVAEGKQRHIRYRDSKLTFILKDSLGGNAKTCLIANISPSSSAFSETLSTLKFAQRAKQIKNKALINEDSNGSIEMLKKEIKKLRDELCQSQAIITLLQNEKLLVGQGGVLPSLLEMPKELELPAVPEIVKLELSRAEMEQKLIELNHSSIQVETMLKQNLESMQDSESLLQVELARKEECVNVFKSAIELYNSNELHYRSIIALYNEKTERWRQIAARNISRGMDLNLMLLEENTKLVEEKEHLAGIVMNTPLIMKVVMENIEIREKIEALEGDGNPTSSVSIAKQLEENAILVRQVIVKLEEDIRLKKVLNKKIERMAKINGEWVQEDTAVKLEDAEIKEIDAAVEDKMKVEEDQEVKAQETEKESYPDQEKYEQLLKLCKDAEEWARRVMKEKETLEEEYKTQLEVEGNEKRALLEKISLLEDNKNALVEELNKSKEEINDLSNKLSIFMQKESEYEAAINGLYSKNSELQERLNQEFENGNARVLDLETELEKERTRAESLGNEKVRMQEELESLNQTISYKVNDLQEKRRVLGEAHIQLSCQKKTIKELECKVREQEEAIKSLQGQIYDQNREDSPFSMVVRENCTLKEEVAQLQNSIKDLKLNFEMKESEIERSKKQALELSRAIDNYAQTGRELVDKLETKSIQIKELQTNLDIKIAEARELQDELNQAVSEVAKHKEEIMRSEQETEMMRRNVLELQEQLKGSYQAKQEMQTCLNSRQSEIDTLNTHINGLKNQIHELEAQIQSAEQQYREEVRNLREEIQALEETCDEKSNEIDTIKACLAQTEKRVERLEREKAELGVEFQEFKDEVSPALNEYKSLLAVKEKELDAQRGKLEEYLKRNMELEQNCVELRRKHYREMEDISQHQIQECEKISDESSIVARSYNKKENAYREQIEELTKQLNEALHGLAQKKAEYSGLYSRTQGLERKLEEKEGQIRGYIESMDSIKSQLDSYMELGQDLKNVSKIKEENEKLRMEVREKDNHIVKINSQTIDHFKAQDEEIRKINENFAHLQSQHRFMEATAKIKEDEIAKQKQEIKLAMLEKNELLNKLKEARNREVKLEKINEKNEEMIKKLNQDRVKLMMRLRVLDKGENEVKGLKSADSRLKVLNKKHRDDIGNMTEDKDKLEIRLNNSLERNDELQKKIDELTSKFGVDSAAKADADVKEIFKLQSELQKSRTQNRYLCEMIVRGNQLAGLDAQSGQKSVNKDQNTSIELDLDKMMELINNLNEKEEKAMEKQRELDAKALHQNILEKELAIAKQKYQLYNSSHFKAMNPDYSGHGLKANKENVERMGNVRELGSERSSKQDPSSFLDMPHNIQKVISGMSSAEKTINSKRSMGKIEEIERFDASPGGNFTKSALRRKLAVAKMSSTDQIRRQNGTPSVRSFLDDIGGEDKMMEGEGLRKKVKISN